MGTEVRAAGPREAGDPPSRQTMESAPPVTRPGTQLLAAAAGTGGRPFTPSGIWWGNRPNRQAEFGSRRSGTSLKRSPQHPRRTPKQLGFSAVQAPGGKRSVHPIVGQPPCSARSSLDGSRPAGSFQIGTRWPGAGPRLSIRSGRALSPTHKRRSPGHRDRHRWRGFPSSAPQRRRDQFRLLRPRGVTKRQRPASESGPRQQLKRIPAAWRRLTTSQGRCPRGSCLLTQSARADQAWRAGTAAAKGPHKDRPAAVRASCIGWPSPPFKLDALPLPGCLPGGHHGGGMCHLFRAPVGLNQL